MRLPIASFAFLLGAGFDAVPAAPAGGGDPTPSELWRIYYLLGKPAGYEHEASIPVEIDGRLHWRTDAAVWMQLEIGGNAIDVSQRLHHLEDEAGHLVEMETESTTQGQTTLTTVRVQGSKAEVVTKVAGPPLRKTIDWKSEWLGPVAFERVQDERWAAGAKQFSATTWSPDQGAITLTAKRLGKETVDVPGLGPRELERVSAEIASELLPAVPMDSWSDGSARPLLEKSNLMGLEFVKVRTDRGSVVDASAPAGPPELFNPFCQPTNVCLPNPHRLEEIVARFHWKLSMKPLPFRIEDANVVVETTKSPGDRTLRIRRRAAPEAQLPLKPASGEEQAALAPSPGIESDAAAVKALAQKAVGAEKDAWAAARKLEKAVGDALANKEIGQTFEGAAAALKAKTGDATEHAQLLAAACRAAGIPARIAVGLCCFEEKWVPHLWTEAAIGGDWHGLDATVALGGVGPTHLRVASDSCTKTKVEELFAKVREAMTCDVDVVSFKSGGAEVKAEDATPPAIRDKDRVSHRLVKFSFAVPPGLEAATNPRFIRGDDVIAVLRKPGAASDPIVVSASEERYGFGLNEAKTRLANAGMAQIKATDKKIDGRPARVFKGRLGEKDRLVGVVVRDTTHVVVSMTRAGPDDEELFDKLLASLDLDG
jgi:hypothetical protein